MTFWLFVVFLKEITPDIGIGAIIVGFKIFGKNKKKLVNNQSDYLF